MNSNQNYYYSSPTPITSFSNVNFTKSEESPIDVDKAVENPETVVNNCDLTTEEQTELSTFSEEGEANQADFDNNSNINDNTADPADNSSTDNGSSGSDNGGGDSGGGDSGGGDGGGGDGGGGDGGGGGE
jgi:hypothetical protein